MLAAPADSLLESGRARRPALVPWATDLLGAVRRLDPTSNESFRELATLQNNLALLELCGGNAEQARRTCDAHLLWATAIAERHGVAEWGDLVLQPWVNLGRLARAQGSLDSALDHFAAFETVSRGQAVIIGSLRIEAEVVKEVLRRGRLDDVVRNVYIVDSTKAFWRVDDLVGAEAFLRRCERREAGRSCALRDEMLAITLIKQRRCRDAAGVVAGSSWGFSGFGRLVRSTLQAVLIASTADAADGRSAIESVADVLVAAMPSETRETRVPRYVLYLAGTARDAGLSDRAFSLFELALASARCVRDVPFEALALAGLSSVSHGHRARAFAGARDALLTDSGHRSPSAAPAPAAAILVELRAAVSDARRAMPSRRSASRERADDTGERRYAGPVRTQLA
jgi:hypothetical protein